MKSILILQNEIMAYLKPVYNGLAKDYEVIVVHSVRPSVKDGDCYREFIIQLVPLWRFHLSPRTLVGKMIGRADAVMSMFDFGWPVYLEPLFWKKRPKYILWEHSYISNSIARVFRDRLMKSADRLLLYGDEEIKRMNARGLDSKKIAIAWNNIEVPNHQHYSDAYKTSLLFVGRLQERTRIVLFIEAFARLQEYLGEEVVLDIVGEGEIENDLRWIAQNLRMSHKINFHGRIDAPDALANIFSRAYAYVSPGPVGLGVLHSLAYGVPVITMREFKKLLRTIRYKSKGRKHGEAQRAVRRLRTISDILIRDMRRKLSPEELAVHQQSLDLYDRVQRQQRSDTGKIYSLHEPDVSCSSKCKAHKKYEFGAKASVTVTKISGIIVGALSFPDTPFYGHTLPAVLSQVESIVGKWPTMAICDRGYRGKRQIGATRIEIPESGKGPKTEHEKRKARERFRRRVANEPIIGHLKSDHRMMRNYLKERIGDSVNLFMASAAFNFRKFIRLLYLLCPKLLRHIFRSNVRLAQACA